MNCEPEIYSSNMTFDVGYKKHQLRCVTHGFIAQVEQDPVMPEHAAVVLLKRWGEHCVERAPKPEFPVHLL